MAINFKVFLIGKKKISKSNHGVYCNMPPKSLFWNKDVIPPPNDSVANRQVLVVSPGPRKLLFSMSCSFCENLPPVTYHTGV